jgi:metal-sulfur cluster biosynthetic enzyme
MARAADPRWDGVWRALEGIKDPCMTAAGMDLSIVDLGLITRVEERDGRLEVGITFTDTGCQFTHRVMAAIYDEVEALDVGMPLDVVVEWRPVWQEHMANERGRRELAAGRERFANRLGIAAAASEKTGVRADPND